MTTQRLTFPPVRHDLVGLALFDVLLCHLDALVSEELLRRVRVVDVGRDLALRR